MRNYRSYFLSFAFYSIFAALLTWPLLPHFFICVPGDGGDDPALTWNLWWVKYALLDLRTNPFDCRYMFYPIGINLAFYTLTVLNAILSIPLQFTFGLIPASNLILLSSFILSAFGMHLLTLMLLREGISAQRAWPTRASPHWAATLAGIIYGFASCKLFYASLGQFNIASSQWIPFFVLFLIRMGQHPGRKRYVLLAALFLIFQAWAEMTFASFLIILTALYALWVLVTEHNRKALSFLASLMLMLGLFALGISPMLAAMVPDLIAEGDFFVRGTGFADVFSADVMGFFLPTRLHPLLGRIVDRFPFPHDKGQHLYPGYATLILALLGLWKARGTLRLKPPLPRDKAGRQKRLSLYLIFFAFAALFFTLLSLGPSLRVNGHDTGVPLPFIILQKLPFFKGNRYPGRYNVMVMLCLAPLAARGFVSIFENLAPDQEANLRGIAPGGRLRSLHPYWHLLAIALIVFEHLSIPLPLSNMQIPEAYRAIAEDEEPGTVLEIPLAWRNGFRITGTMDVVIMFEQFYQTFHHKPILGGNTSRNPDFKFQYFTEAPVINSIIALENGHQVDETAIARDKELAPYVARFFNIHYVIIHPDKTPPALTNYLQDVFNLSSANLIAPAGSSPIHPAELPTHQPIIYHIAPPPAPDLLSLDMASPLAHLSRGEGWAPVPTGDYVWAQRRKVRLLVPLSHRAQWMRLTAYAPGEGQTLTIAVNGRKLPPVRLNQGWGDYEVTLPPGAVQDGLNEFVLHFSRLFPAIRLSILIRSAGMDVGDFGYIYVNGINVSPNKRGYNIVVLNPETGELEITENFDTFASEEEAEAMAEFLARIPEGHIVAVAARDEASLHLTEEAVHALGLIGAEGDLRGCFRCSHAIIGVKGMQPGQALEALSPTRPANVWLGEAISEPHVAAAFKRIEFRRAVK
ncbi:MAG: hypothetical protein DRI61_08425 [Chloroflexi bacterium]|nr:MAG: hypothetical protein DRI61_08425 [Chloroflexota bacterium]